MTSLQLQLYSWYQEEIKRDQIKTSKDSGRPQLFLVIKVAAPCTSVVVVNKPFLVPPSFCLSSAYLLPQVLQTPW
jgi:hypothetical protein